MWNKSEKQEYVDPAPVHDVGVIQSVLDEMREELEDHRLAINENTTELQSNYACIIEIDQKLNRVIERLEALEWVLQGKCQQKFVPIKGLVDKERMLFKVIYRLGVTQPYMSYRDISKTLKLNENVVASLVTSMIEKGVPILKRYEGNLVYLKLDNLFREEQAKKNLVVLDSPLSCWM